MWDVIVPIAIICRFVELPATIINCFKLYLRSFSLVSWNIQIVENVILTCFLCMFCFGFVFKDWNKIHALCLKINEK